MKKFVGMVAGVAVSAVLVCGCGSKDVTVDVHALGNDLSNKIVYQDSLMELDADTAAMFLNLSDINIADCAIYEGSGATAEEIVVIECASKDDAAKAESILKDRVNEQKDSFTDYVPEELVKLDKAVIVTNGKYAVLSVSDDADGATAIINSYMK